MNKINIALFLLFVISPLHTENRGFSFGNEIGANINIAKDTRFPSKAQFGGDLSLFLDFPIYRPISFGISASIHKTWPSSLTYGFVYRGFHGSSARIYLTYKELLYSNPAVLDLLTGMSAGASVGLNQYTYTELYFFNPGILLEPLIEFQVNKIQGLAFVTALPVNFYFRKDLSLFMSFGINLKVKYYPFKKKEDK